MFSATITVDLPSAERMRKKTWFERFKSLFGVSYDLSTGVEELTVDALEVVDGVMTAFAKAGVTNAISFMVDRKVIFRDDEDNDDDLTAMHRAALSADVLKRKFKEMHVVLTHHEGGVHALFDVRIARRVALGTPEMSVRCAGRVEGLRIKPSESAAGYQRRVREATQDPKFLDKHRKTFDALVARVQRNVSHYVAHESVTTSPTRVEVIRLQPKQVAKLGRLRFGHGVETPAYRAVPARQRHGAYHDPFYYYYYDPYSDLLHYLILREMYDHGCWHDPHLCVIDPTGALLCDAAHLADAPPDLTYSADALSCADGDDGLIIPDEVLSLDDGDPSEQDRWAADATSGSLDASPNSDDTSGWGASDADNADNTDNTSSGGWSSDDTSSSSSSSSDDDSSRSWSSCSSSSSSCGSSCSSSSSSCGSSCSSSSCSSSSSD